VTSAAKVLLPSASDFIDMLLNQFAGLPEIPLSDAVVLHQFDLRLNPKLRLTASTMYVNMHSPFFPRKEEESKSPRTEYRRTHPPETILAHFV
jgi:hypothetical protein